MVVDLPAGARLARPRGRFRLVLHNLGPFRPLAGAAARRRTAAAVVRLASPDPLPTGEEVLRPGTRLTVADRRPRPTAQSLRSSPPGGELLLLRGRASSPLRWLPPPRVDIGRLDILLLTGAAGLFSNCAGTSPSGSRLNCRQAKVNKGLGHAGAVIHVILSSYSNSHVKFHIVSTLNHAIGIPLDKTARVVPNI